MSWTIEVPGLLQAKLTSGNHLFPEPWTAAIMPSGKWKGDSYGKSGKVTHSGENLTRIWTNFQWNGLIWMDLQGLRKVRSFSSVRLQNLIWLTKEAHHAPGWNLGGRSQNLFRRSNHDVAAFLPDAYLHLNYPFKWQKNWLPTRQERDPTSHFFPCKLCVSCFLRCVQTRCFWVRDHRCPNLKTRNGSGLVSWFLHQIT